VSMRSAVRARIHRAEAPAVAWIDPSSPIVRIRVWELPIRVIHWTIVAAILVLSVTGFLIGTPIVSGGHGAATGFLMGKIRAVHYVTGWVLLTAVLARIYWAFAGNRWARWNQLVPTTRRRFELMWYTFNYYIFRRREPPPVAGHNPLAGLTYLVVYGLISFQIVTGFALSRLARGRSGVIWFLTGWAFHVFPIPVVRLIHHLTMWFLLGFMVHHVYSALLVDSEERSGLLSSIITGDKHIPEDRCCE
jgi:Ni/Fe-hydrogenase 1 B-type cytochrome subunit